MIIGICGKAGAGKSTALQCLSEKFSFENIEIDVIAEKVIKSHLTEINDFVMENYGLGPFKREEFYDSYFSDGLVAAILDFEFKRYIERLIYNEVLSKINRNKIIVLDWFMLELSKIFDLCDYKILLEAPYEVRKERIIKRGNYSKERFSLIESVINNNNRSEYNLIINTNQEDWINILISRISFDILGDKLVSVIVPVYNQEECLYRCLRSIVDSSYRKIEVIVVNDGSTDCSQLIIDNFAKNDNRVIAINQCNKGVGAARNSAIMIANGDYICFVDSDDFIDKNMITVLLNNALLSNADISRCRAIMRKRGEEVNVILSCDRIQYDKKTLVLDSKEKIIDGYINREVSIAVWDKMFSSELCKKINFDVELFNEDAKFVWDACMLTGRVCCTDEKLYYHIKRKDGNSLTGHPFDQRYFSVFSFCDDVLKCTDGMSEKQKDSFAYNTYAHILKAFIRDKKAGIIVDNFSSQITDIVNRILLLLFKKEDYNEYFDLENVLTIIEELRIDGFLHEKEIVSSRIPCIGIIWNSVPKQARSTCKEVLERFDIEELYGFELNLENSLYDFISDVYELNNDKDFVVSLKQQCLFDRYDDNTVYVIEFVQQVNRLSYLLRKRRFVFNENELLRNKIRDVLRRQVKGYVFDTVFHLTDSKKEYEHLQQVLCKYDYCRK